MAKKGIKERRASPRYKVWIACSLLLEDESAPTAEDQRRPTIVGHTHDLSKQAIAVILPANQTFGIDPGSLGSRVEMTLAFPDGYLKLSCSLLRHEPMPSQENLVVFKIEGGNVSTYQKHLKS